MLALDLSLSSTGFALFNKSRKLISSGSIRPPKLTNDQKIHYITHYLRHCFDWSEIESVCIEDTYMGKGLKSFVETFKQLNRLAGAVIYIVEDVLKSDPCFYNATEARRIIGINSQVHKFDSQAWVLQQFFPEIDLKPYIKKSDELRKEYVLRRMTKSQYDYQLEKLSGLVGKETGKFNDESDAIIIGLAHLEVHKPIKKEIKNGK